MALHLHSICSNSRRASAIQFNPDAEFEQHDRDTQNLC
jgi:hypothetical protein